MLNCYKKVPRFSPAGILWKKTFKWKIKLAADVVEKISYRAQ